MHCVKLMIILLNVIVLRVIWEIQKINQLVASVLSVQAMTIVHPIEHVVLIHINV